MTSLSYWQQSIGLPGRFGPSRHPSDVETELCVIGGGVIGSSAAYLAAQQGLSVLIMEGREPGLGASGRNAGMVLRGVAQNYAQAVERYGRERAQALWQLSIDNREMMLALAHTMNVPYDRCGSWLLADAPEEAVMLAESDRLLREDGFADEYHADDPLYSGFLAGIFRADDAVLNPAQFVSALIEASGADVLAIRPVSRIEPCRTGHCPAGLRVFSEHHVVHCRYVFIATNAYTHNLSRFCQPDHALPGPDPDHRTGASGLPSGWLQPFRLLVFSPGPGTRRAEYGAVADWRRQASVFRTRKRSLRRAPF